MPFPERSRIETAILQELKDLGEESPRTLVQRLARYFPQLEPQELRSRTRGGRSRWRLKVRRARDALVRAGYLEVFQGRWRITEEGRRRAEAEELPLQPLLPLYRGPAPHWSHDELKRMLVQLGRLLGKHALEEYHGYDVVWKESESSPRISHVFEVQVRGNIYSALGKLKRAYDAQRSRPFLVVGGNGPRRVAEAVRPYLEDCFHEIRAVTTVLSAEDVYRLYRALTGVGDVLAPLLQG